MKNFATEPNFYTRVLLEKYIVLLMTNKKDSVALQIISLSRIIYPNNIDFLFYEYIIKFKKLSIKISELLDDLLFQCLQIGDDFRLISQKDDQLIKGLIVKMLNSLDRKDDSLRIEKELTDSFILTFLETNILANK